MNWPFLLRRVEGASMLPVLRPGQLLLVRNSAFDVGDVVLFAHEGLEKVKRVSAADGQRVFLAGDNAAVSTDSRHFGWLPGAAVRGKVVWPRTALHRL